MPQIKIPKKEIINFFNLLPQKVFMKKELNDLFYQKKKDWNLPESTSFNQFIDKLKKMHLSEVIVKSKNYSTTYTRYVWGVNDYTYQLSLSLRSRSYLSHLTAMQLHGLTDKATKTIYVNSEQSPKPYSGNSLLQERIDNAFKNKPRTSKFIFNYTSKKICCLNGISTKNLGVIELEFPGEGPLSLTNIERTLIDITVRPVYAGGCKNVLEAYKRARNNISVKLLTGMLKKIRYVYPYHQSIGFYMQKAGYSEADLAKIKKFGMKYDFYLDYAMKNPRYSEEWKIYYPKTL